MNAINNYSFIQFFKNNITPVISPFQRRITVVAAIAFSCLAACFAIYLLFCLREEYRITLKFSPKDTRRTTEPNPLELAKCKGSELKELDLSNSEITTDQLKEILLLCPNLNQLKLNPKETDDRTLQLIAKHTKITELNLEGCQKITDAGVIPISNLTTLRKLSLRKCDKITVTSLIYLKNLRNLNELDLMGCTQVCDSGISYLKIIFDLKKLNLQGCNEITDTGMLFITGFPLEELNLSGCTKITNRGLERLLLLNNLKVLNLSECPQLTDNCLVHLAKVPSSTHIDLRGCPNITEAALIHHHIKYKI